MVTSTEQAGNIIRRIREDRGISRAELSVKTGVAPRTLYDLETGRSENFGMGNYFKLLDALDLSMDIGLKDAPSLHAPSQAHPSALPGASLPWDNLADIWQLDKGAQR